MRSSKNRSRSKSNRQRSIGNIINRVFDSSGPEGKVRGTPQQIIEKYLQLARDAQLSNDRVAEQNFLQHAEHYTRMLGEATAEMQREQEARQQQGGQNGQNGQNGGGERQPYNQNRDRYDQRDAPQGEAQFTPYGAAQPDLGDDAVVPVAFGEDGPGIVETPEARTQGQPRGDRRQNDRPNDRQNDRQNDRPRDDRPREDRQQREDRYRENRNRSEGGNAGNDRRDRAAPEADIPLPASLIAMPIPVAVQDAPVTDSAAPKAKVARAPRKPKSTAEEGDMATPKAPATE